MAGIVCAQRTLNITSLYFPTPQVFVECLAVYDVILYHGRNCYCYVKEKEGPVAFYFLETGGS